MTNTLKNSNGSLNPPITHPSSVISIPHSKLSVMTGLLQSRRCWPFQSSSSKSTNSPRPKHRRSALTLLQTIRWTSNPARRGVKRWARAWPSKPRSRPCWPHVRAFHSRPEAGGPCWASPSRNPHLAAVSSRRSTPMTSTGSSGSKMSSLSLLAKCSATWH